MPKGHYNREASRAHRFGLPAQPIVETARASLVYPSRIRLTESHGFIDDIGAVYGPKLAGYETDNPLEIAVLVDRGARHKVV